MLFEARDLHHVYADGSVGLSGCSLRLRAARRHALLGSNGSGKTTFLQHLNGLLRPTSGSLFFEGAAMDYRRETLNSLRRRVGLVFQNPDHQILSALVAEEVSYGPINLGLDDQTVRQRVAEALESVGLLAWADRPVHQLSFGQKKRVCIAGVLAMQPEVLLLDEPLAGLDAPAQTALLAVLDALAKRGVTLVLTTHDVDFAYRWADEFHLLAAGQCVASFPTEDLPQHEERLREAGQPLPVVLALCRRWPDLANALTGKGAPRSVDALLSRWPERNNS